MNKALESDENAARARIANAPAGTRFVLTRLQLPTTLPIWSSLTAWLFLDRVQAPGWVWGVVGTVFAVLWAVSIYSLWIETPVPLKELDPRSSRRFP
jgi:hypothetical protein